MKKPRRALFNLASGLSLASCVLFAIAWYRSNPPGVSASRFDRITFTQSDPQYWIISQAGKAVLCRQVGRDWDNPLAKFDFLGITFGGGWGKNSLLWNLAIPYWILISLSLVLPSLFVWLAWRSRLESRRQSHGLCPQCGYDLRATPDCCPECGAVPLTRNALATPPPVSS